jgi:hypothetical protein
MRPEWGQYSEEKLGCLPQNKHDSQVVTPRRRGDEEELAVARDGAPRGARAPRWVGPLGCIDIGWDFKNRERETKVSWAGPSFRTSVPRLSEDEARTVATIPYRNRKR